MDSIIAFIFDPVTTGALLGALALIMFGAAVHKFSEPNQFLSALSSYRVLPQSLLFSIAKAIPVAEIVIGAAILIPMSRRIALLALVPLLAIYAAGMAINLVRGRSYIDCGCGGAGQQLSWSLVVRNAVLCVIALMLTGTTIERSMGWLDRVALIVGVLAFFATYLLANELVRQASRMNRAERQSDSWSSL